VAEENRQEFDPTDEDRFEEARFRYGVIAPLVQGEIPSGKLAGAVRELAERIWTDPKGRKRRLSERTIYLWLKKYRKDGFLGLMRLRRADRGKLRAFSEETLKRLITIREDQPERSTATLLHILELERRSATNLPSRSTVDRHMDKLGKSRKRMGTLSQKVRKRIVVERINQLWVGDLHDGPKVLHPVQGIPVESHLSAFIDHKSRLVPFGMYYLRENIAVLEDSFRRAIGRRGIPERVYVDNALIYHSVQFEMACLRLGSKPPTHSKAYDKESRGVIERFNETIKQDFEAEVRSLENVLTLDEMNEYWWAYLEEKYHRREHSETKRAPVEYFEESGFVPRFADVDVLAECFRVHVRRKVHPKRSEVEVRNRFYKVDPDLRKRKVDVFFDPFDDEYVVIYFRGRRIQRAYQKEIEIEHKEEAAKPSQVPYLDMLKAAHERRLRKQAAEIAYRELPEHAEGFRDFVDAFETVLGGKTDDAVRSRLERFWKVYGPVSMDVVRLVVGNALACGETGLHINHYLDHVRRRIKRSGGKSGQEKKEER
jgi:putative transposase